MMDPVLRMYNAAMNVTATRMSIIKDEFKYRGKRCPIHHIDTRLKSVKSILGKLEKKHLELSLTSACNHIFDIAGVRVVCPYIKDVYLIRDRLLDQDDIYIMEIKDYIEHPKKNGYRSLHMIIRVPVYFMNKKQFVPVEVQIRTEAMDLWASLEHDIKYKSLYQDIGVDFTGELLECSQLIYQAEEKMEFMNNLLEEPADKAVYRIVHFMGYGAYLEERGGDLNKAEILEALGAEEPTPGRLLSMCRILPFCWISAARI